MSGAVVVVGSVVAVVTIVGRVVARGAVVRGTVVRPMVVRPVVVSPATVVTGAVVSATVVSPSVVSTVVVVLCVVQSGPSNAGSVTLFRPKMPEVVTPVAASASLAFAHPTTVDPVDSSRNWPRLPE